MQALMTWDRARHLPDGIGNRFLAPVRNPGLARFTSSIEIDDACIRSPNQWPIFGAQFLACHARTSAMASPVTTLLADTFAESPPQIFVAFEAILTTEYVPS